MACIPWGMLKRSRPAVETSLSGGSGAVAVEQLHLPANPLASPAASLLMQNQTFGKILFPFSGKRKVGASIGEILYPKQDNSLLEPPHPHGLEPARTRGRVRLAAARPLRS